VKVSCIIPSSCSKNILSALKKCIRLLRRSSKLAKVKIKIFLVTDFFQTTNPIGKDIDCFINTTKRTGFGVMNNIAIEKSLKNWKADWFLLINDDAYVGENFFKDLLIFLKGQKPDIVCPIVYKKNIHIIDSWGIEYFRSGYATPSRSPVNKTTLAPGTCLLIRNKLVKKMKRIYGFVFNPKFYYYHEDVEMSIRAIMIGAQISKTKNVTAYHIGQSTSRKKLFFLTFYPMRNLLWVIIFTWPFIEIVKNIFNITVVYLWLLWSEFSIIFPFAFLIILVSSVLNFKDLLSYRRNNLRGYSKNVDFSSVFSPYIFRTRKKGIPLGKAGRWSV
jgi:GT2 family glycosyltransferase